MALPASTPKPIPRSSSSNVVDLGRAKPQSTPSNSPSAVPDNTVVSSDQSANVSSSASSSDIKQSDPNSESFSAVQKEDIRRDDVDVLDEEGEYEEGYDDQEGSSDNAPHFDFLESFFLISINVLGDAIELLGLSGVGVVAGFLIDWFVAPAVLLWLWFKNVPAVGKTAVAQALEFIPFVDILPIRTVAIVLTIIGTNHPEAFAKLGFVGDMAKAFATKGKSVVSEAAKETMGKDT